MGQTPFSPFSCIFLYFSPFLAFYFYLFFKKTMKEDEVMEEPERLLSNPKFALYTLFLLLIYFLSAFLEKPQL